MRYFSVVEIVKGSLYHCTTCGDRANKNLTYRETEVGGRRNFFFCTACFKSLVRAIDQDRDCISGLDMSATCESL